MKKQTRTNRKTKASVPSAQVQSPSVFTVQLKLDAARVRRLEQLQKWHFNRCPSGLNDLDRVARWTFDVALLHLESMSKLFQQLSEYQESEGIQEGEADDMLSLLLASEPENSPFLSEARNAGCDVERNVWIKLGIPKTHAKRLRAWTQSFLSAKCREGGKGAWLLFNTALSHLPIMERLLASDGMEIGKRGLWGLELVWEKRAKVLAKAMN